MRRDLARHVHAGLLAFAHRAERRACAHVRDVEGRTGQLGQQHASLDTKRFARARHAAQAERRGVVPLMRDAVALERRILAVLDDRHSEHPGVLERAPQQDRRPDRMPVVCDGDAAGLAQIADVGEQLAF